MEADLAAYEKISAFGLESPKAIYGDDLHEFEPAPSENFSDAYYLEGETTVESISLVQGMIAKLDFTSGCQDRSHTV